MTRKALAMLAASVLGLPAPAISVVTCRDEMIWRAEAYLRVPLHSSPESNEDCLWNNYAHPNYRVAACGDTTQFPPLPIFYSDIYIHQSFANGQFRQISFEGVPYRYGGCSTPDQSSLQAGIDACRGLGSHECHHTGNGCSRPGCPHFVGVDCSGAVGYIWGLYDGYEACPANLSTCSLDDPDHSVHIQTPFMLPGSALNRCGSHVVLVAGWDGPGRVNIYEATGAWPVFRYQPSVPLFNYQTYQALDSKHVTDCQASDGVLAATLAGDGRVELRWAVEWARNARRFEFQYQDLAGAWWTFASEDYRGPGTYQATYTPDLAGAGGELRFRIWEVEADGRSIPHEETLAFPPAEGRR